MRQNQIRFASQNHSELATQISKVNIYNKSVICNIKNGENNVLKIYYIYAREGEKGKTDNKQWNISNLSDI